MRFPIPMALLAAPLALACASMGGRPVGDAAFTSADRTAIARVLEDQAAAWNRGDLDAFMEGYWNHPDLVFTSGGRVQRGWDITLERYRATYGTAPATMGHLSFTDLEVHALQPDAAWVLGRWALDRDAGQVGGVFTLVFREMDGQWKIVHDHTSVGE